MKYFNGFSLKDEEGLFDAYLTESVYCVAGFSYGAQKAFEYVYHATERIDRLILLSPAFFQTQKPSFIRTQLRYFEAGHESYVKQFLSNIAYPSKLDLSSKLHTGTKQELDSLLTYQWEQKKIREVLDKGITIEVFIGNEDKIVDTQEALKFFKNSGMTTYLLKKSGHLLRD